MYTFFFRSNSPFSQWYSARFVINGISFNCCEQYMMFKKAELFNDKEAMKKILATTNPKEHKAIGRTVKNFDQATWDLKCEEIVYEGNKAKFSQNPQLGEILKNTKDTILVEASPYDRIWGVGLAETDPRIYDNQQWRGLNKLGYILTQLRIHMFNE